MSWRAGWCIVCERTRVTAPNSYVCAGCLNRELAKQERAR